MADFNFDIWRLQAQGDVPGLMALLRHANPDIRRRAATALRALGATAAIPGLQAALVMEGDADVRSILVSALDYLFEQALNGEDSQAVDRQHKVVFWIAQLSSDKPEQIIRAAQSLAELNEKIAAEALVLVFRNQRHSPHVRLAIAEALLKLESAPVEVTLLAALRHQDWHTRRNAAGVLGQLHADWAVEPLAAALRDPSEMVRRTAYAALRRIDTPEARRAMEPPLTLPKVQTGTVPMVAVSEPPAASAAPPVSQAPAPEIPAPTPPVTVTPPVPETPPVAATTTPPAAPAASAAPPVSQPPAPEIPAPTTPVTAAPPVPETPPIAATTPPPASPVTQAPTAEAPPTPPVAAAPPVSETPAVPAAALTPPAPPASQVPAPEIPAAPATSPVAAAPPVPESTEATAPTSEPQSELETKSPDTESLSRSQPAPVSTASPQAGGYADEETQPVQPILGEDTA